MQWVIQVNNLNGYIQVAGIIYELFIDDCLTSGFHNSRSKLLDESKSYSNCRLGQSLITHYNKKHDLISRSVHDLISTLICDEQQIKGNF